MVVEAAPSTFVIPYQLAENTPEGSPNVELHVEQLNVYAEPASLSTLVHFNVDKIKPKITLNDARGILVPTTGNLLSARFASAGKIYPLSPGTCELVQRGGAKLNESAPKDQAYSKPGCT